MSINSSNGVINKPKNSVINLGITIDNKLNLKKSHKLDLQITNYQLNALVKLKSFFRFQ